MCGICGFTSKIENSQKYLKDKLDAQGLFHDEKINLAYKL